MLYGLTDTNCSRSIGVTLTTTRSPTGCFKAARFSLQPSYVTKGTSGGTAAASSCQSDCEILEGVPDFESCRNAVQIANQDCATNKRYVGFTFRESPTPTQCKGVSAVDMNQTVTPPASEYWWSGSLCADSLSPPVVFARSGRSQRPPCADHDRWPMVRADFVLAAVVIRGALIGEDRRWGIWEIQKLGVEVERFIQCLSEVISVPKLHGRQLFLRCQVLSFGVWIFSGYSYSSGPNTGNNAHTGVCSDATTLAQAQSACDQDPSCSWLHSENCAGQWRYCFATREFGAGVRMSLGLMLRSKNIHCTE